MIPPGIRLLLDTSFCIYLIRAQPPQAAADLENYAPGELGISALTVAALERHVQASQDPVRNRRALDQFLLPLVIVDFDSAAAQRLAQIDAQGRFPHLQASALLAAQALDLNATLVTRRPERYAGIAGLRVQETLAITPGTVTRRQQPQTTPVAERDAGQHRPRTIVVTGSHDLSLDLLAEWVRRLHPDLALAAAHVGSLAGLLALRQHEAHLAGTHLFDEATGEFNVGHVRRLLRDQGEQVVLVAFVGRTQGLIVAPGNPKGLETLADLPRPDVRFINRQAGAGTRLLLDYHLRQAQIPPQQVHGYTAEAPTHLAVAASVARGDADCGLGIQAAAQALGLAFVPLYEERFDLAIPAAVYHSELLAPVLALLRNRSAGFAAAVEALGGYRTAQMGDVLAEM